MFSIVLASVLVLVFENNSRRAFKSAKRRFTQINIFSNTFLIHFLTLKAHYSLKLVFICLVQAVGIYVYEKILILNRTIELDLLEILTFCIVFLDFYIEHFL